MCADNGRGHVRREAFELSLIRGERRDGSTGDPTPKAVSADLTAKGVHRKEIGETLDWTRQTNPASNVRVAVWALWVHRTSAEHRLPERVLGGLTGAHHTMRHPEPSRSDRSRRQSNAPA